MKWRCLFLALTLFLCAALARPAAAGDFRIVPGQRIGSVALGMSRQDVIALLHPPHFSRRLADSVTEDSWTTPLSMTAQKRYFRDGRYWKDAFVNVYFQQGRVVQVEINSPLFHVGNLSVNSPAAAFEKRFRPYLVNGNEYDDKTRALAGVACKHVVVIEDAMQRGIAWRFGSWGDGGPEADPSQLEVIIIHRRGMQVILEPDGDNSFVQTNDLVR